MDAFSRKIPRGGLLSFLLMAVLLPAALCASHLTESGGSHALADSIKVMVSTYSISCAGRVDGRIDMLLLSGQTPVAFQWQNLSPAGGSGNGVIADALGLTSLDDLKPGLYRIDLTAADGTSAVYETQVTEPQPLVVQAVALSDFQGYAVACVDGFNGVAGMTLSGGTPGYSYFWSNGSFAPQAEHLSPGKYDVTVTDANGCTAKSAVLLDAPPPLKADVTVEGEKCFGENTGAIHIHSISGGIAPYQSSLEGGPFGSQTDWTDLEPGHYFLVIRDANGCDLQDGAVLPTGLEFTFSAGPDTAIFSGDTLHLQLSSDVPLSELHWSPANYAQATGPSAGLLFPYFTTTYTLTAIDTNGCAAVDELKVEVHRNRAVYAPNVFMPQGKEAGNRAFTLYTGGGVSEIALLQVYNRLGNRVFENTHFAPNQTSQGWQGDAGNHEAGAGVYFWYAVLRYTDGREEELRGDVTLLR